MRAAPIFSINPIALSLSKGVRQYCTPSFDGLRTNGNIEALRGFSTNGNEVWSK